MAAIPPARLSKEGEALIHAVWAHLLALDHKPDHLACTATFRAQVEAHITPDPIRSARIAHVLHTVCAWTRTNGERSEAFERVAVNAAFAVAATSSHAAHDAVWEETVQAERTRFLHAHVDPYYSSAPRLWVLQKLKALDPELPTHGDLRLCADQVFAELLLYHVCYAFRSVLADTVAQWRRVHARISPGNPRRANACILLAHMLAAQEPAPPRASLFFSILGFGTADATSLDAEPLAFLHETLCLRIGGHTDQTASYVRVGHVLDILLRRQPAALGAATSTLLFVSEVVLAATHTQNAQRAHSFALIARRSRPRQTRYCATARSRSGSSHSAWDVPAA